MIFVSSSWWSFSLLAEGYSKIPSLCWSRESDWSTGESNKWTDIGKYAMQIIVGHVLHGAKLKQMQNEFLYWYTSYRNV